MPAITALRVRMPPAAAMNTRAFVSSVITESDRHQAGARLDCTSRWPGTIPVAPYRRQRVSLALKHNLDNSAWTDGRIESLHYRQGAGPVSQIYDQETLSHLQQLGRP
jgi:hypothetical protein